MTIRPCGSPLHPTLCRCSRGGKPASAETPLAPGREPVTATKKPRVQDGRKNNGGHPNSRKPKSPWLVDAERRRDQAQQKVRREATSAISDDDRDRLMALERQLLTTLCIDDFAEFCRQAWHVVEPTTKLDWNWHHQLICNTMQALFESWLLGRSDPQYVVPVLNTVFSVAPGALKSRLVMVFFPAWCWLRSPGTKFICLSVNEDATLRDARAARDLIKSDWYQSSFSPQWALKGDQDAISNYGNTAGGDRLSKPSGSAIVGLRADILLYDDPNSPDENAAERAQVNKTWDEAIYSRVNSVECSIRIGIQQRVGALDWTAHVISRQGTWEQGMAEGRRDGWLQVVLPAEFEEARRFVLPEPLAKVLRARLPEDRLVMRDPRKVEGESVHPSRYSIKHLAAERRRWEGTGNYAAQYQQRPSLAEGSAVKRAWLNWFRLDRGVRADADGIQDAKHPRPAHCHANEAVLVKANRNRPGCWEFDWVVLTVDCAAKKTERGSAWAMVAMAGRGGERFVLDDRTRRGDILEIIETLREMIRVWRPDKILIEDKAAGVDLKLRLLASMREGDLPVIALEDVKVGNVGKEERLDSCKPAIANGLLYILEGANWVEEYVDELCSFPAGKADDRVDATSQALNYYMSGETFELPDW